MLEQLNHHRQRKDRQMDNYLDFLHSAFVAAPTKPRKFRTNGVWPIKCRRFSHHWRVCIHFCIHLAASICFFLESTELVAAVSSDGGRTGIFRLVSRGEYNYRRRIGIRDFFGIFNGLFI
ncbi:hypothetical protein TVAGG3_0803780 [Trichomonas vaginalis G3]|uniref:hypothetical protein n=1 Tax=Trichomonas vaginalis (strain ATCC PRA-98 / G3) TaxID=412133 RepID=UPI0021E5C71E|nr:hypothetical protein TVAGG3_0803780 [Trichomonas vaginalis G3]KAI5496702.1 hypothetical protein TVAGG3_0803780 [Trichomonas vaginalis G3]